MTPEHAFERGVKEGASSAGALFVYEYTMVHLRADASAGAAVRAGEVEA